MEQKKLERILADHAKWLIGDWAGIRANLCGANLCGTDLRDVDLRKADLRGAILRYANMCNANLCNVDLRGADLCCADLSGADLHSTNLCGADLRGADLRGADLRGADLRGADLRGADLRGADLCDADLRGADLRDANISLEFFPICCPESGAFVGWKRCGNYIVKLLITETARRSSGLGRKCRCSEAVVLEIQNMNGSIAKTDSVCSNYDTSFVYKTGATVRVDNFDDNRLHECTQGIHFFITRREAVDYR